MPLRTWTLSVWLVALFISELSGATNLTIANGGADPVSSASFAISGDKTISPTDLATALGSGVVDLQANADTSFSNSVTASGTGDLVVQSGRSIVLGSNVALSLMGSFLATAHDSAAMSPPAGAPSFNMGSGSSISAPNGISIGNPAGAMVLASLTSSAGTVRLTAPGDITGTAGITASALGVHGTSLAPFLTNSSNNVGTIAAAVTGNFAYASSGAVNIGNVSPLSPGGYFNFPSTSGLNTTNGYVSLNSAGNVTQSTAINAGTGLELLGSGSETLANGSNHTGTLAANITADVIYTDSGSFNVGSVHNTSGIAAGNIALQSSGTLGVNGAISAGANTVRLVSSGNITQSAAISGGTHGVRSSTGSVTLSNAANNVSTFAAAVVGDVTYANSGALTIGSVTDLAQGSFSFGSTSGITAANATITSGGDLTVSNADRRDRQRQPFKPAGLVTQSAAITATALQLLGAGSCTLTNASNHVGTLAASTTGSVSYTDSGSVTVGTANGTDGITASSVTLSAGSITISKAISATNNVSLSSTGAITQTAKIAGAGLEVVGDGSSSVALTNASNHVGTLAANTTATGDFTYADSGSFNVGMVNGTTGITAGNVALQSGGSLGINGAIAATTNVVRMVAAGDITQTAGITASTLGVRGTSLAPADYTLTNSSNNVGTIAAAVTGNFAYASSGAVNIGNVSGLSQGSFSFSSTSGLNTTNGYVSLNSAGNVTRKRCHQCRDRTRTSRLRIRDTR